MWDVRCGGGSKGILWIGGLVGVHRRKSLFAADREDRNADREDGGRREERGEVVAVL